MAVAAVAVAHRWSGRQYGIYRGSPELNNKLKWVDIGYGWVPLGPVARFDSVLATVVLVRTCLIIKQDKSWQMSGPGVFHAFLLLLRLHKREVRTARLPSIFLHLLTFFASVSLFFWKKNKTQKNHIKFPRIPLEWISWSCCKRNPLQDKKKANWKRQKNM